MRGNYTGKSISIAEIVQKPMVVAHRGFSGRAPENTMAAFKMAIDAGVDMIELDVQVTKDGYPVVIHDNTVDRTTDGKGKVSELTLKEIRTLDAGSWFNKKFSGERVPTLEEALGFIAEKTYVNIELKANSIVRRADTEVADAALRVIESMNLENRVLFSSFNQKLVRYMKRKNTALHMGVIFHPIMHFGKLPSSLAVPAGAEVFICNVRNATPRRIADARKHNIVIGVYGIESENEAYQLLMKGINVLVSDFPEILVQGVARYANQYGK